MNNYDDDYDEDDISDDEVLEHAMADCGQMGNGYCSMAGSEYCDWSCPLSNPHRMKDLKEHMQVNGIRRR